MIKRILVFVAIIFVSLGVYSMSITMQTGSTEALLRDAFTNLLESEFYVALASPESAFVKIPEGSRKEQILAYLDKRFVWDEKDEEAFLAFDEIRKTKHEGTYFPDTYLMPQDATGSEVRKIMEERFDTKLEALRQEAKKKNINFDTAVNIASIIQREAAGISDRNIVSGIIWNRIFAGMKLQMDATLQYAKGTEDNGWWPKVVPADKKIESPYNTYKYAGLPPSPIANPGLASIKAALNPTKTSCLFYFHKDGVIYCSKNYEEHKRKIDLYLK